MSAASKPRRKSSSGPTTARAFRTRKGVEICFAPDQLAKIDQLAAHHDVSRTCVVEIGVGLSIRSGTLESLLLEAARVAGHLTR